MIVIFLKGEGFQDYPTFVEERASHFSNLGKALKLSKSDGDLGTSGNPILSTTGTAEDFPLPANPTDLAMAIEKCEAVKSTECSIFDNPAFTKDCGLCLEIGENSEKVPSTGGLVVIPSDKTAARQRAAKGRIPSYSPTIGSCPADRLVTTKQECQNLQRELLCQKNSSYDLPGCSQCYSSTEYSIVDPKTSPGVIASSGIIHLYGNGSLLFIGEGFESKNPVELSETTPYILNVPVKESSRIKLTVNPSIKSNPENPQMPTIFGVVSGPTQGGTFDLDLRRIVLNDEVTGRKPRAGGTKTLKASTVTRMAPGFGQQKMILTVIMPFTFVDTEYPESTRCKDAPFVTMQSSAEFLQSDPCYKKGSGPGKFSLECLQGAWVTNGCSEQGRGYPANDSTASNLMARSNGSLRTLNDISDFIYKMALITSTGANEDGEKQTIENWSKASVFCTGREITSPCDTPTKDTGPLSPDCINYLWKNKGDTPLPGGIKNPTGPTYTGNAFSFFKEGVEKRYCQDTGTLAPSISKENVKYWQKFGGIAAVKREMNNLYVAANAQLQADDKLAPHFKKCYGDIEFAKPPPCSTSLLPPSYVPKQNTVLASNLQMTQDFILTMDITPRGIVGNWGSIIHFTTGPDCCSLGNRAPGIWFYPNTTNLLINLDDSNNVQTVDPSNKTLTVGKTSNLKIECRGPSVTVTLDGITTKHSTAARYSGIIKTVFGSDPWYTAANCSVENVCLQTLGNSMDTFKCSTNLLPKSYTPAGDRVLAQSITMTQDYKLEFDITPKGLNNNWASIIHFSGNGMADNGVFGYRTPGIWFFPGQLGLHVRVGDLESSNYGFDNQAGCVMNERTHVSLECRGKNITLKVGSNTYTLTQPNYRYSGPAIVYGGNPGWPSANCLIQNLCLVTYGNSTQTLPPGIDNVGFVRIQGGPSSSYLNMSQLVVFDNRGRNVSKKRPTQSSGSPYGPPGSGTSGAAEEMANDGDERPRPHPYEFHGKGNNDFWQVKLDGPTTVTRVVVYNRSDCCTDRMGSGFVIKLINPSGNVLWTSSRLSTAPVQTIQTI